MTQLFLTDFDDRRRQVRHYLAIVVTAERMAALGTTTRTQERRLLTLRAGTFLLIYNLIEATMRGALEAIHDSIRSEEVPFGSLSVNMRREVVRLFKKGADPDVHHTLGDFPSAFVAVALEQNTELSGNVDAKLIRALGECYGFSCLTSKDRTWNGADLLIIKDRRNDLAHGRQTFEDVGRGYPYRELLALTRRSLSFINDILVNIAVYLVDRT